MGLNQQQLSKHIDTILQSRRILNKIVVLCEGDIQPLQGRPSPQEYRKMEKMPDTNFYKACVPRKWSQRRPQFFNCGDRKDVINTYFGLLEQHNKAPHNSYLAPSKLFAMVDLDLQSQRIDQEYQFNDTEEIFHNLYERAKVNETNAAQHRIWVTGFIHKEAYFLQPDLQDLFDNYPTPLTFQGSSLTLDDIYLMMSNTLNSLPDLQNNFAGACSRIAFCDVLDCQDSTSLKDSWQNAFRHTDDPADKNTLIYSLLMITKAKEQWHQVLPDPGSGWTQGDNIFREQLTLEIGRFISEHSDSTDHHLSAFFRTLHQSI